MVWRRLWLRDSNAPYPPRVKSGHFVRFVSVMASVKSPASPATDAFSLRAVSNRENTLVIRSVSSVASSWLFSKWCFVLEVDGAEKDEHFHDGCASGIQSFLSRGIEFLIRVSEFPNDPFRSEELREPAFCSVLRS